MNRRSSWGDSLEAGRVRTVGRGRLLAVAFLALIGVVACSSGSSTPPSSASAGGGTLTVRLLGDWITMDPSAPVGQPQGGSISLVINMAAYDRLVAPGPNGQILPYLAKSWTVSPSSQQVTFNLQSGLVCADGTPLTATAIANSVEPLLKSPSIQFAMSGGPWTATPNDSANQITFGFAQPNADSVVRFASPFASGVCPAGLANASQLSTTLVGSGAYTLTSAVHGSALNFARNPRWKWGPGGLTTTDLPDTLIMKIIASNTTAANEILTGTLDGGQIVGTDVDRLIANPSLSNVSTSSPKLLPLVMNQTAGHATADPQVRRAIMAAIDPKAWAQAAFPGHATTGTSLFASTAPCYDPSTAQLVPKYDLEAAKQILRAAGYTQDNSGIFTKGGQPLTVTVLGTQGFFGQGTAYTAAQLTTLGMKVITADVTNSAFGAAYVSGKWDVSVANTSAPNPAPSTFMSIVSGPLPPQGTNYAHIVDPQLDADVKTALTAVGAARCPAWAKVQQTGLKNFDWLPLASPVYYFFGQKKVTVSM